MRIRDLLELVRIPNVFTAPADVAMGLAVSGAGFDPRHAFLFGASMLAYAGGMALNDVCDAALDAKERPKRPIPSGRVSRRAAFIVAALLLGGALALAAAAGLRCLLAAAALVTAIVVYDSVARRTAAGPIVMGACRALDASLGIAAGVVPARGVVPALLLLFYVMTITTLSRFEVTDAPKKAVKGAVGDFLAAGAGCGFVMWRSDAIGLFPALAILGILAVWIGRPLGAASKDPSPRHIIAVIKASVLGIIFYDAAFVAGALGVVPGLIVAALFLPAYLLGRRFASA